MGNGEIMEIHEALLTALFCGLIGGLANIMIYKDAQFSYPRIFIDEEGNKTLIFGSMKELFLGVLAGILSILPVYEAVPGWYVFYLSLLSGVGGSTVITGLLDKRVNNKKKQVGEELSQYDITGTN
jgi:hypothetical protein